MRAFYRRLQSRTAWHLSRGNCPVPFSVSVFQEVICIILWCVQWRNSCFTKLSFSLFFFPAPHFKTPLLD